MILNWSLSDLLEYPAVKTEAIMAKLGVMKKSCMTSKSSPTI